MENASKALIMAGGILIGIIVLSIGVFLYLKMAVVKEQYNKDLEVAELAKFNTEITVFKGRENIRAYEIISLINFVKSNNTKNPNQPIELRVVDSSTSSNLMLKVKTNGLIYIRTKI